MTYCINAAGSVSTKHYGGIRCWPPVCEDEFNLFPVCDTFIVLKGSLTLVTSETLFYHRQGRATRTEHDRSFILTFFDIFKHLRGSGTVDKIKKFRRDVPWEFLPSAAVGIYLSLRLR